MQDWLLEKLSFLQDKATAGHKCRAILKMNALTDDRLAIAIAKACLSGVKIDLIVRGACILPPAVPGFTQGLRVRSVIGRFLEHTRLNMFEVDAEQELFLSSADWMNRNMMRRVEIAWPIENKALRKRLIDECLNLYLQDNQDAWLLKRDGTYERVVPVKVGSTLLSAQTELLKKIQKSSLSAE